MISANEARELTQKRIEEKLESASNWLNTITKTRIEEAIEDGLTYCVITCSDEIPMVSINEHVTLLRTLGYTAVPYADRDNITITIKWED